MRGVVARCLYNRDEREEVLVFSEAKEPTEVVLSIPDRMRAFALSDESGFHEAIE